LHESGRYPYQITGLGKKVLVIELPRYRHIVALTYERKLITKTFAYGA